MQEPLLLKSAFQAALALEQRVVWRGRPAQELSAQSWRIEVYYSIRLPHFGAANSETPLHAIILKLGQQVMRHGATPAGRRCHHSERSLALDSPTSAESMLTSPSSTLRRQRWANASV